MCGLLAGCAGLWPPPDSPVLYDLGPPASGPDVRPTGPALLLGRMDAPAPLHGTQQWYRLDYADGRHLRAYARSRWSAPPAQLVRQRLKAWLSRHWLVLDRLAPEAAGANGGPAGRVLRLELEEFAQRFDAPASSRGRLRLQASLWSPGPNGERLLSRLAVDVSRPAPTPDAAGGTRALADATDAAAQALAAWLRMPG